MTVEQFLTEALQAHKKRMNIFKYVKEGIIFEWTLKKWIITGIFSKEKKMIEKAASWMVLVIGLLVVVQYPYSPIKWGNRVSPVIYIMGNVFFWVIMSLVFNELMFRANKEDRFVKKIIKQYKQKMEFSGQEIVTAAKILRSWEAMTYEKAVKTHGKRIVDVLLMARAIYPFLNSKKQLTLKRLVSIKAIEENREAGWEE
ncbi:MAG: hypothetical protein GW939_03055 [Candidatus Magasanikbacteria bacterium]|nr:hypothetical protein [Candidatus Magasanikbacteria bacterium]NCS72129.1 hypothetical protein [Candidatus Magasanikbacteria bacterium]